MAMAGESSKTLKEESEDEKAKASKAPADTIRVI
jgi:hypothetical protein